jgi:two-component system sensor histidine kinase VanS
VISRRSHAKKVSLNTAKHIRNRLAEEDDGWPSRQYGHITPYIDDIRKQISDSKKLVLDEVSKKNDLIAYLAHDLKTPLTSVIGYLSLLEEAPEMPTEQKAKYIHISLRKAQRLETLINEFFDITRYNLHEMLLEKENIDLGYMLNQMVDEFYPLLQSHGNSVSLKIPEDLRIHADPVKLARVFNNILKNAIAYSYADSLIEISANAFSETVRITFTNAGNTIPKLKLDTIFEKFYRMDEARSTNTGGAGLGLAIAKEIVLRHGGTISAQSEDHITSFTVELSTSE